MDVATLQALGGFPIAFPRNYAKFSLK